MEAAHSGVNVGVRMKLGREVSSYGSLLLLCPFLQDHETPDLQLLLAMTDLLASCSEGENLFIESVCQTVYSVEELLKILKEPYLPPERKRPFARFLVWVYMNTEGDKMQSGASEVANKK